MYTKATEPHDAATRGVPRRERMNVKSYIHTLPSDRSQDRGSPKKPDQVGLGSGCLEEHRTMPDRSGLGSGVIDFLKFLKKEQVLNFLFCETREELKHTPSSQTNRADF